MQPLITFPFQYSQCTPFQICLLFGYGGSLPEFKVVAPQPLFLPQALKAPNWMLPAAASFIWVEAQFLCHRNASRDGVCCETLNTGLSYRTVVFAGFRPNSTNSLVIAEAQAVM